MKAVATGAMKPPRDAAQHSFSSLAAVLAVLTTENRLLLRLLNKRGSQTTKALVRLTGRHAPELRRSLERLHAAGFVDVEKLGRARIWVATPGSLNVEIDLQEGWERIEYVPRQSR